MNKHPNNPWIYIHWGDLYNPEMSSKTANKDKAIAFYKDAIRIAINESDRDIALDRLYKLGNVDYRKLRYSEAANHDKFMEIDDFSKV
ncbi:hypothetical protein CV093_16435 [Oceanobacillus sp. 143]|nr:hypothetical protein CV093_16435 [Oceanobacillus sp. 143]